MNKTGSEISKVSKHIPLEQAKTLDLLESIEAKIDRIDFKLNRLKQKANHLQKINQLLIGAILGGWLIGIAYIMIKFL